MDAVVHADSRNLEVKFNYEFLEDFQDEQSSDKLFSGEEGATNIYARYTPREQIFLSLPAYLVIVMLYPQQYWVLAAKEVHKAQSPTLSHCE